MSSDDAILVRKNERGNYVAQTVFMSDDVMPPIEKASIEWTHLEDLILAMQGDARQTEYGFQFAFDRERSATLETIDESTTRLASEAIRNSNTATGFSRFSPEANGG